MREGEITALDSYTALTTLCGDAVSSAIPVPPGMSRVSMITTSSSQDGSTASACSFTVKLTGTGIADTQYFSVGASTNVGTETSDGTTSPANVKMVNIPVKQNGNISVFGGVCGSADPGTAHMAVELLFE